MEPLLTPGRIMIILGNVAYSGGAWLADWNETHGMSIIHENTAR